MNPLESNGGGSEVSSMESFNGSWIKLDSKGTSPKLSDEEDMTEALADAQTEVDRSVKKGSKSSEEKEASKGKKSVQNVSEWMSKNPDGSPVEKTQGRKSNRMSLRGSKVITSGYDFFQSTAFYASALVVSHALAITLGIYIGRKMISKSR